jgi:hypothetical protein
MPEPDAELAGQVGVVAASADTVLGVMGVPPIVGDLSSMVLAAWASIFSWKKLRDSGKGKIIGE